MWLIKSSIGRKFIMALTGICLVLFVTFHVLMNAVAICWPTAYNQVCMFLGANWYALIASAGLGLLVVIHIIYAVVLTLQNRKARGNDRYAVNARPKSVEWSSQNMLVLGIVIVAFLGVHLAQFWAKMQYQELIGSEYAYENVELPAAAGTLFLQIAFQEWWTPVVYLIGFIALWFHMNHGFWSMFQSIGWNNIIWLSRLKKISCCWVTIVIALFVVETAVFTWRASEKFYFTDSDLQAQYIEMVQEPANERLQALQTEYNLLVEEANNPSGFDFDAIQARRQEIEQRLAEIQNEAGQIVDKLGAQIHGIVALGNEPATPAAAEPATETAN